jgi:hypothetical protein
MIEENGSISAATSSTAYSHRSISLLARSGSLVFWRTGTFLRFEVTGSHRGGSAAHGHNRRGRCARLTCGDYHSDDTIQP